MLSILSKILLSATLYNLAFYYPDNLGFLSLIYWVPLFYIFNHIKTLKSAFATGVAWGLIAYGAHCQWLLNLLIYKSDATLTLSLILYSMVVLYSSLTSAMWLFLYKLFSPINKLFTFLLSLFLYQVFISKYFLWLMFVEDLNNGAGGYPFFSPLIPLASNKTFLKILSLVGSLFLSATPGQNANLRVIHLKPEVNYVKLGPIISAQKIYHKLAALRLDQYDDEPVLIVSPESAYPFDLEGHLDSISLWSHVLPKNAHLLIGSINSKLNCQERSNYQAIYHISNCRIMQRYEKQHLIPFVERVPKFWNRFEWSRGLFLAENIEFELGRGGHPFLIGNGHTIQPQICSEAFFLDIEGNNSSKFYFINDSWFTSSFKRLMINYLKIKSALSNNYCVYVGFDNAFEL